MQRYLFFLAWMVLLLQACKKEKSFELGQRATGTLQDNQSDCLPKLVNGPYVTHQPLGDSNYIDVTVNVAQAGNYKIFSDTLNGYYFRAEGNFTHNGTNVVRLKGAGTPDTEGDNGFTIFFDSSFCLIKITVAPVGGGGSSVFALKDSAGSCAVSNIGGTYTKGVSLTATHTVTLSVNVITPGSWSIATPVVNGFSFFGSGNFSTTGPQTIVLTGTGIPSLEGAHTFTVTAGSSSCPFAVTVLQDTTQPASGIYFPLTQGSWWSYDNGAGSDSIKITVNGTKSFTGNTYQQFITSDDFGPFDTSFFRKDNTNGFYYTYVNTGGLSSIGFSFSQPGLDVLFLKDALTTGAVFNSDHSATYQGVPITVRFQNTVTDANASITVNGRNFTNVYKIEMVIQAGSGTNFQNISLTPLYYYFAKDIGMIKLTDLTDTQDIKHWQIN